ncbi:type II secretion system secretin GspD [Rhodoligotrophos defluvii]|uniref:type II secretion system secretin GspD n=1 Tax=Rhodoligotrophos defluvii TaxID=2561934 RepID=UPI001485AFC0|nr:type II secretion system secretin GspD [Rhodoligotrophos defluvii]
MGVVGGGGRAVAFSDAWKRNASSAPPGGGLSQPELYRASELEGADLSRAIPRPLVIDKKGAVSLNFVNVDVKEVVNAVLGDALGLNYTIDPSISGQVTTRTSKPLPKDAVIPAIANMLAVNGAALVPDGKIWYVVPADKAKQLTAVVVGPDARAASEGRGVHMIPLSYSSPNAILGIIQGQINPGSQIAAIDDRKLLIFVGPNREARLVEEMVAVLDTDRLQGRSFALLPLKVAAADAVVDELEVLFSEAAETQDAGEVRFVAIERLNAVLVITKHESYLEQARDWVKRLDRANPSVGRRMFVYFVKNGRAAELAETLNALFAEDGQAPAVRPRRSVAPGLQPVSMSEEAASDQASEAGAPLPEGAPAVAAGSALPPPALGKSGVGSLQGSDIRIIADERNNALLIRATAEEYESIGAMLARLDILPLQVLIEATVAEVTLTGDLNYGVEWFLKSGKFEASFSSLASGAVAPTFPGFNLFFDSIDASVVLTALSKITDVKVISSPKLMVLDNQSARLQVGDQVPVATQSAVSTIDPDAPIVNSISLLDTGIILEVRPTVNAGGLVSLQIMQEVSDATVTRSSNIDSPTIQKRKVESRLAVQSGETVALAGLIRDRTERGKTGIPLLSDIPGVGTLFSMSKNHGERTELLVLLTPRVVRDPLEIRQLTQDIRRHLYNADPVNQLP